MLKRKYVYKSFEDTDLKGAASLLTLLEIRDIEPDGESWFYDLYLDVVVQPTGEIDLLDEDELSAALRDGLISKEQYDLAYKTVDDLLSEIEGKVNKLEVFCMKYYKILKELEVS